MAKEGHNGVHCVWISSHHLKTEQYGGQFHPKYEQNGHHFEYSVDMNTDHLNTGNIGIQMVSFMCCVLFYTRPTI